MQNKPSTVANTPTTNATPAFDKQTREAIKLANARWFRAYEPVHRPLELSAVERRTRHLTPASKPATMGTATKTTVANGRLHR